MNKKALLALFVLLCCTLAGAQQYPTVEVFGGYSYARVSFAGTSANYNGWNASLEGNLKKWFGVIGDFGGVYGPDLGLSDNRYFLFGGPQITARGKKINVFGRVLVGATRKDQYLKPFSMLAGGGVDWHVRPHLGIRLVQADYILTRFQEPACTVAAGCGPAATQNNFRLSAGVVFYLGKGY